MLVAIRYIGRQKWDFQCDCGKVKTINGRAVRSGNSRSCGCGVITAIIRRNFKHGKSTTPEHGVWRDMKKRCYNTKAINFKNYGGRGIFVSEEWIDDFQRFYSDMGPRPTADHQIERRDNDGPYCAGNCHWETRTKQCRNKRNNHILKVNGKAKTIQEWSEITGINHGTIETRIRRHGWSDEMAVKTPVTA